jgi:hypothetical protein
MSTAMSSIWPKAKLDIAVDIANLSWKTSNNMYNGIDHIKLQARCLYFCVKWLCQRLCQALLGGQMLDIAVDIVSF